MTPKKATPKRGRPAKGRERLEIALLPGVIEAVDTVRRTRTSRINSDVSRNDLIESILLENFEIKQALRRKVAS